MIDIKSESMPVLAIIENFQIDDGKLKELIYWLAHHTVKSFSDPDNQDLLNRRVKASLDVTERMAELGYEPTDPGVMMKHLFDNLVRVQPVRENDDELTAEEVVVLEGELAHQRTTGLDLRDEPAAIVRKRVADLIWQNSSQNDKNLEFPPQVPQDTDRLDALGLDSVALVHLVIRFEEEFNIEIPDDDIQDFLTFGDVNTYIGDKVLG